MLSEGTARRGSLGAGQRIEQGQAVRGPRGEGDPRLSCASGRARRARIVESRIFSEGARMQVSIVVPVHNGSETIEDCLKAIFAAEYPSDQREVIVVDDGSTDDTPQTLHRMKGEGAPFVLIRQPNRGSAAARDAGIKAAKGEIVFIISQDTFAEQTWLAAAVAKFRESPHIGIVQGQVALTDPIRFPFCHATRLESLVWAFPTVAIAYRAQALDRAGRYFDLHFTEYGDDVDIAWRIIEQGYTYKWLDQVTARHGVYRRSFLHELRRSFPGPERFVLLVKRHPQIRQFFYGGILWSHPRKLAEVGLLLLGLGVSLFQPFLGSMVAITACLLAMHRHRRTASTALPAVHRYLVVPLHVYLCEVLLFLALVYGSVRYRSLVL